MYAKSKLRTYVRFVTRVKNIPISEVPTGIKQIFRRDFNVYYQKVNKLAIE